MFVGLSRLVQRGFVRGCLSVVCDVCTVAKPCVLKQKLLLTAYRKTHIRNRLVPKINDLDLCLEVVQGHVNHCVRFAIELHYITLHRIFLTWPM